MICPRCQTPNSDEDKFCEQCGAPLPALAQPSAMDDQLPTMLAGPGAPSVLVRIGPDGGTPYPLGSRAVVGRLESCDVPVNDKSVSREHARLSRLRDGYVIEDLGSTNGTMVNGKRINEAVLLRPGDRVTIGSVDFRYEVETPAQAEPVPLEAASTAFMQGPPPAAAEAQPGYPFGAAPPDLAEAPTMHEVPPVPVTFPPLEPFASAPEEESAAPEAPRRPAESPPPPPAEPAPVAAFTELAESAAVPIKEAAKEPRAEVPSTAPDSAPAPESSGRAAAATAGSAGDDAAGLLVRLGTLLTDLTRELDERRSAVLQLQKRVAELEESEKARESLRSILREVPEASMQKQQLRAAQDLFDSLIENPRDVGVLMQLGEQAPALAAVFNEYGKLRRLIDKMERELEG